MRIISFAWTTPALIAGHKTCTRRDWRDDYAARFEAGALVAAYDRSPRFKGRQVATIKLTQNPYKESTADMPEDDWIAEGFAYMTYNGKQLKGLTPRQVWETWRADPLELWVVRFELVEPEPSSAPGGEEDER